jgi:cyanophycinase
MSIRTTAIHTNSSRTFLKKAMLVGVLALCSQAAVAACLISEVEPNNSDTSANTGLCSGTAVSGTISTSSDYDWYRIDVASAGTISLNLAHQSGIDLDVYLYPSSGSYVAYASTSSNPETLSYSAPAAGTYYIRVKNYSGTGTYSLTATFPSSGTPAPPPAPACRISETESNNSDTNANTGICSGTNVSGSLSSSSDNDWYTFDIQAGGTITVNLSHGSGVDFDWYLYPETGTYVAYGASSANPQVGSYTASAAGTYYLKVKSYSGSGNYTVNVTYPLSAQAPTPSPTPGPTPTPAPTSVPWPCTLPSGVDLGKVGSTTDVSPATTGGFVLMGGGTDVDAAMQWMINKSGGGDVVVLRSTGTNGYNDYIYTDLGGVNSVQTLLIDNATEGDNACVGETIKRAEMVFIAGGNQQNYIDYFNNRAVGNALNHLINTKQAPIGGTSAGMMIQGQYYHPGGAPDNATVLQNPTTTAVGNNFINNSLMNNTVTDTHFSQRNRQPRLMTFMASSIFNHGVTWQNVRGIACDEASAYALEPNGTGKVFGGTGACFFAKATGAPETLNSSSALTWNLSGNALNVYRIAGTTGGTGTFNVNNWTGTGGTTQYWSSNNGTFSIK